MRCRVDCCTGTDVSGGACLLCLQDSSLKYYTLQLLGAFGKLRKATMCSVLSVCPSVRVGQLGSHRTDFHEI